MKVPVPTILLIIPLALGATGASAVTAPIPDEAERLDGVYSFVGALEGEASLFAVRSGSQSELELNLPILRGDRIWTTPRARLAVLMSDRSVLALDYDSEVTFAQIAGSPDSNDPDSLYVLHRGRLGLEVASHLLESELPAVDTPNARVYAKQGGRYQVHSDGDRWSEVTVLDGFAEVVTQRGSAIVRGGEVILVRGVDDPWIELQTGSGPAAASLDDWTEGHRARLASYAAVDADGYRSTLDQHGRWVDIEDRRAWKPDVDDDWQPYSRGRWTDTPAGLYWVARDPWGPVPYHYGSWNQHPGYGWLWFPGRIFAPNHVYWYWGPSYVGWIPRGYYRHYYGGRGFHAPFGLYGWAGGYWDPFNTWIFCPTGYVGYGRGYTYGRSLRRSHPKLERGLITTDTNGIDRRNWRSPESVEEILLSKRRGIVDSDLPDVTDFVARRPDLNESLRTQLTRGDTDPKVAAVPRVIANPGRPGLVGVTGGGVRAQPAPAVVKGTGSGGTIQPTAPGAIGARGSRPLRARPVATDAEVPAERAVVIGGPKTSAPVRVSSGGVKATSPSAPAVAVDAGEGPEARPPTRVAAPRSSGSVNDGNRRPTPARRVLDAIRGRDATPSSPRVQSIPRTSTPRSTPPRTRSTPPRASTPKATATPRTRSTPRTSSPRSTPPRTRATPSRASTPKATATPRTRSTPRTSTPRSTPPRTRSTPRSSSPRSSSPPTRSYSPPSTSSSPRASSPPPSRSSSSPPPSSSARTPPFRP